MDRTVTRRRAIRSLGAAGVVALAGCSEVQPAPEVVSAEARSGLLGPTTIDVVVENAGASGDVRVQVTIYSEGETVQSKHATTVSMELDTDLGSYAPAKHQWDEGDIDELGGSFSRNFAQIRDRECYVVDDTITSGTTMRETIGSIREEGGDPAACVVIVDKQGLDEIEGVPVYSLIDVVRVGRD